MGSEIDLMKNYPKTNRDVNSRAESKSEEDDSEDKERDTNRRLMSENLPETDRGR